VKPGNGDNPVKFFMIFHSLQLDILKRKKQRESCQSLYM